MPRRTIDEVLADAQARLRRLTPRQAQAAVTHGWALVDTRSPDAIARDGRLPGAVEVPLSVLEWRVDPASKTHSPALAGYEDRLVLICQDGYSSSLAATRLVAAAVLAVIAIRGMFQAARVEDREIRGPMYLIFLTLTMLNPPTVIYFVSLAVALPEVSHDLASRASFVAGAFLASLSWQEVLAIAGATLHGRMTPAVQRGTALVSGVIILALAVRIAAGQ